MNSGTGTCSVMYDQAGNANYNAAPEVTETVNPGKSDQTISVTTHAPSTAVFGTSFGVAASAPGGAVAFSSGGSCTHNGATFTMTSGTGACTVNYDQGGNSTYNAAPEVTETVTAQKAAQSISVTTHAPASAVFGSQFTVAANAPGGAVSYSSTGSCTNNGATFTITNASGTCSVNYSQSGNGDYNAATAVNEVVSAQAAFGGFQLPLANAVIKAGSKITAKFTLTNASGQPLSATAAAALAAANSVEVALTGPNGNTTQLASALCAWVSKSQFFQCNLNPPSGLQTGTTNPYSLTALQNVGGQFVPVPPYTNTAADANPETIFFQPRVTVSAHVGQRKLSQGQFLRARIAGRMTPAVIGAKLRFTIQRYKHGAWRTMARRSRKLNAHYRAKVSIKLSKTGRYRVRASFAGDTIKPHARSGWKKFRVR
jgi:hypothetical protein